MSDIFTGAVGVVQVIVVLWVFWRERHYKQVEKDRTTLEKQLIEKLETVTGSITKAVATNEENIRVLHAKLDIEQEKRASLREWALEKFAKHDDWIRFSTQIMRKIDSLHDRLDQQRVVK